MSESNFASQLFEAQHAINKLDDALFDHMLAITGHTLETCPWSDITYDWYGHSFELKGLHEGFELTPEQRKACWGLGFNRCWLCYTDGTEEKYHYKGEN